MRKMLPLPSQQFLRDRFNYDPSTGIFTYKVFVSSNAMPGMVAGVIKEDGYVAIAIFKVKYLAHRLAWVYVYGDDPYIEIDHENRNPSDNRIVNLRPCGQSKNSGNIGLSSHNTSGFKGVCWDKSRNKWTVHIKVHGVQTFLGRYVSLDDAVKAYDVAAINHFGSEFALTNRRLKEVA